MDKLQNEYVVDVVFTMGDSLVVKADDSEQAKQKVIEMIKSGQLDITKFIKLGQNVTVSGSSDKENEKIVTFF